MALVRRLPFTLFVLLTLVVVALWQGSMPGELSPAATLRWGFGSHNLWEVRLISLLTAPFFVGNPLMLLGNVVLLVCSLAVYEWLAGTWRAALVYGITHLLGFVAAAVVGIVPWFWPLLSFGQDVALGSHVGPSAGALGCAGGWVSCLPARFRWLVFLAILTGLIGKLVLFPDPFADLAGLVAFPAGFALGLLLGQPRRLSRGDQTQPRPVFTSGLHRGERWP